jgi:hypothetical protein
MTLKTITASIALLGIAATAAQAVQAAEPEQTGAASAPTVAEAQARRVVRDKETGKLRAPNDEELQALLEAERADRKARGEPEAAAAGAVVVRQHANGMRSAVLGPEHMVYLKAQRTPDGKLVISHDKPGHEHAALPTQRPTE